MLEMVTDKIQHMLHIGTAAGVGIAAESLVANFDPSHAISIVQVVAQAAIALVTVFATIKKAFQKPIAQAPNEQ